MLKLQLHLHSTIHCHREKLRAYYFKNIFNQKHTFTKPVVAIWPFDILQVTWLQIKIKIKTRVNSSSKRICTKPQGPVTLKKAAKSLSQAESGMKNIFQIYQIVKAQQKTLSKSLPPYPQDFTVLQVSLRTISLHTTTNLRIFGENNTEKTPLQLPSYI